MLSNVLAASAALVSTKYEPNTKNHLNPIIRSTLEEAKAALLDVKFNRSSISYGITMEVGPSSFETYIYKSVPCYGYLRVYGPHSTRPNDPRPSDLPIDYPLGKPVLLCVAPYGPTTWTPKRGQMVTFPYRNVPFTLLDNGCLLFEDLSVDSTLLLKFIRDWNYYGRVEGYPSEFYQLAPEEQLIMSTFLYWDNYNKCWRPMYDVGGDIKKYLAGELVVKTGPFNERFDYNRPEVDYLWGRTPPFKKRKYTFEEVVAETRNLLQ